MTSASAPSSLVSHDDSSPAAAFRHSSRKRQRTSASNVSSGSYQRSRPAARQKARISAGATSQASVMNRRPRHAASGGSLVFIPQFAAQDFSDIGLRQTGPKFDLLGDLVVGQLGAAELDDVLGGEVWILLDDKRLDGFARARVGNADHGALQHAGVACDHFLDLVGIDVEARDQDHVLLAVDDLGVAVGVHHADVAGAEIAV